MNEQLRQTHGLLYLHVGSTRHLLDVAGSLASFAVQFGHILAIEFDGNIGLGTRHQLVETELDRLAEIELGPVDGVQTLLHLLHHLGPARRRSPFAERLHDNHHVGIFDRHRVGRHLGRTDFGHHVLDFGETLLQPFLGIKRNLDAPAQRTAGREGHLHGKITLVESRYKLGSQFREEQQGEYQGDKCPGNGAPHVGQTETERPLVKPVQPTEETVGQRAFDGRGVFQAERSHHGHVGQGENKGSYDTEDQGLGHRRKVFPFNSRKGQDGEEHNQDDEHGKSGTAHHATGTLLHLVVHLFTSEGATPELFPVDMGQDTLQDDDGTVDHNTEVDGTEAHQVGRHVKDAHQDKGKEHGQRNDRRHNQSGPHITQEDNEHEENDNGTLYQIAYHGRDIAVHQFRAVQIRLNRHPFGQHLLHLGHPLLQLLGHHVGIGPFEHHGNTAHTLTLAVLGHGTEALGGSELHPADVADVYRYAAPVGHHNLLHIFQVVNHTFRADIVGPVHLLDIAAAGILVVAAQGLEHLADSDVERIEGIGIDRHLVLFQITAEAVDFDDTGNTRELPLHNPVLNGAQLHGVVTVFIARRHFEYILINLAQSGGDRHQLGRSQLGRNLARHHLNLLVDQLTGIQRGHVLLENHRHERQPETRHRANLLDIHHVAHGYLDREGNELFHLLWSQRGRHGDNLHLVVGDVGYGIDGQRQHGVDASRQKQQRSQGYKQLPSD